MTTKRQRPASLDKQQQAEDTLVKKLTTETENSNSKKEEITLQSKATLKQGKLELTVEKRVTLKISSKGANFSEKDIKYENQLNRQYFRQEVAELAKSLLGKMFIRETPQGIIKAIIVETEAYKAPLDKACHAYNNKKTERTKYFWLDGGHLYIYTIYMPSNICLNVIAGLEGQPEGVLIRAVQPVVGLGIIQNLRQIKSKNIEDLTNGPGKVGQSLGVQMATMNGMDLAQGAFKIVDAGISGFEVDTSRRVNIDYAEEWIDKQWRFFIRGNSFVSKVNFNAAKKQKKDKKSS